MSPPRPSVPVALAGLVLAAALVLVLVPGSQAQPVGLYSVDGTVRDPGGDPVAGAEVTLIPVNASGGERTTRTDDGGRYGFGNLSQGTYDLTARASCCGPDYAPVEASGATLSQTRDLSLADQRKPASNETVVLRGRTQGIEDGEAVPDVRLRLQAHHLVEPAATAPGDGEEPRDRRVPREEFTVRVRSEADGTYAVELPRGHVDLEARRDGYDVSQADPELEDDRRIDVPVRASETPAARLGGVVRSDDGAPVPGAHLVVGWQPGDCRRDPCQRDGVQGDERRRSDGVWFRIQPAASRYDRTAADADGRWNLSVHPGTVELRTRHHDHLPDETRLEVAGGEERRVDVSLERIPPPSVELRGTVTDAATGEPVPSARVLVENQAWGTRNATRTGEDGTYELRVRPGYATLSVRAGGDPVPCARPVASNATAGSASGDGTASSAVVRPEPCPEGNRERDRGYLPWSRTLEPEAGEERTHSPALRPEPARSATLQGWVLNASSGEEIPDVTLRLRNEVTGDRVWTTTDGNGSFSVDVRPGYHTLRAPALEHRDAYYEAVRTLEVAPDTTRTLALNLTPGTPRHGCCVVYGAEPVADRGSGSSAGGSAGPEAGAGSSALPAPPGDPGARSPGGGLGPYDPAMLGTASGSDASGGDGLGAPGPGVPLAAAGIALAAAVARRRP